MMGFSGSLADLAVLDTNIRYGVTYLARAYRLAGGDLCTATMKYRVGHGETRFSYLSVDYCRKVRARLIDARSSDLKKGVVNLPAVQQQYGKNFGRSVIPYRPGPPPVYTSPLGRR